MNEVIDSIKGLWYVITGIIGIAFYVFKADARSKRNETDIEDLKGQHDTIQKRVNALREGEIRTEAKLDGIQTSIDEFKSDFKNFVNSMFNKKS